MKILLFGASGRTGEQVIVQALASGHEVTAVVRDPNRFTLRYDRLRVASGDALDPSTFVATMPGHDVVVSALGIAGFTNSLQPMTFHVDTARTVANVMKDAGVDRLIAMTSVGVLEAPATPLWYRMFVKPLLRHKYADMAEMEAAIRDSGVDYTIVRPVRLVNGPLTQRYRIGAEGDLPDGGTISRADVADFIVRNLPRGRFSRREVALSY